MKEAQWKNSGVLSFRKRRAVGEPPWQTCWEVLTVWWDQTCGGLRQPCSRRCLWLLARRREFLSESCPSRESCRGNILPCVPSASRQRDRRSRRGGERGQDAIW